MGHMIQKPLADWLHMLFTQHRLIKQMAQLLVLKWRMKLCKYYFQFSLCESCCVGGNKYVGLSPRVSGLCRNPV